MPVSITGNTFNATCSGCCSGTGTGTCTCQPCPVCRTDLLWITITAATGNMAVVWFGVGGYATLPATYANPFTDGSVEVCGGFVSAFSIFAQCVNNAICVSLSMSPNRDVTCVTETAEHSANDCSAGTVGDTAIITMGTVVCDAFGFASIDFTVDCGVDGTFSGTISR